MCQKRKGWGLISVDRVKIFVSAAWVDLFCIQITLLILMNEKPNLPLIPTMNVIREPAKQGDPRRKKLISTSVEVNKDADRKYTTRARLF